MGRALQDRQRRKTQEGREMQLCCGEGKFSWINSKCLTRFLTTNRILELTARRGP